MQKRRSLGLTPTFVSLDVSMDHRVKPGGDERGENAALNCLARARNDEAGRPLLAL
jgi:hypothetical protein